MLFIFASSTFPVKGIISPLVFIRNTLHPLQTSKKGYQVYGYAPYWTFNNLANIDFNALTTFAYFGIPVDAYGNLVTDDPGYTTFISDQATQVFKKAHDSGTHVDLTVTQMDNYTITSFLDSQDAQNNAISQIAQAIKDRGIDGVSVDFEYTGDPGVYYRNEFTRFVSNLRTALKAQNPQAQVTVAVYALSVKSPKMYDIPALAKAADRIFMMAYDFAVAGSDYAQPTAPLYGYKQGIYSYDVSTAVDDFLTQMPPEKLVLGVPYYGYNYLVYQPGVNSETLPYWSWQGSPRTEQYTTAEDSITPSAPDVTSYTTGWDNVGDVGWKAYQDAQTGAWRMIFIEDQKSLGMKYDFAKSKNLAGVGIWALGFDQGHTELWDLLHQKFGEKLADSRGLLYK